MSRKPIEELAWVCVAIALGALAISMRFPLAIPPEPDDQHRESVDSILYEGQRSNQWQSVRNKFVELHPSCEACGSTFDLNVHHIQPFHEKPELELDTDNLITLCREHHFRIGHDPDGPWGWRRPSWKLSNPNVREHAKQVYSSQSN